MSRMIDLIGKTFGRLTVVRDTGKRYVKHPIWECVCDCGRLTLVTGQNLRRGITQSCGCLAKENLRNRSFRHGGYGSREYRAWGHMWTRCTNPNSPRYKSYGGRGISVCPQWKDFSVFLNDMGKCPTGLTLERKNVNGNYCPENCMWADWEQQFANRQYNRWITVSGKRLTLSQWSKLIRINPTTISHRIDVLGWTEARAITTPLRGVGQ